MMAPGYRKVKSQCLNVDFIEKLIVAATFTACTMGMLYQVSLFASSSVFLETFTLVVCRIRTLN